MKPCLKILLVFQVRVLYLNIPGGFFAERCCPPLLRMTEFLKTYQRRTIFLFPFSVMDLALFIHMRLPWGVAPSRQTLAPYIHR
jgi:hypothetical protein